MTNSLTKDGKFEEKQLTPKEIKFLIRPVVPEKKEPNLTSEIHPTKPEQ